MAIGQPGVYLGFDNGGDGAGRARPDVGPYDEIVLRGARAVGEREGLGRIIASRSSTGRWRDAEAEPAAYESGVPAGSDGDLRVSSREGDLFVRFLDDEIAGAATVPDLGPFATVLVGTHDVRADAETLAVRVSRIAPWQLTDRAGAAFQGVTKDALVFVAVAGVGGAPRADARETVPVVPSMKASAAPVDEPAPAVWVDRVRVAPEIYVSRPDVPRKR